MKEQYIWTFGFLGKQCLKFRRRITSIEGEMERDVLEIYLIKTLCRLTWPKRLPNTQLGTNLDDVALTLEVSIVLKERRGSQ